MASPYWCIQIDCLPKRKEKSERKDRFGLSHEVDVITLSYAWDGAVLPSMRPLLLRTTLTMRRVVRLWVCLSPDCVAPARLCCVTKLHWSATACSLHAACVSPALLAACLETWHAVTACRSCSIRRPSHLQAGRSGSDTAQPGSKDP